MVVNRDLPDMWIIHSLNLSQRGQNFREIVPFDDYVIVCYLFLPSKQKEGLGQCDHIVFIPIIMICTMQLS